VIDTIGVVGAIGAIGPIGVVGAVGVVGVVGVVVGSMTHLQLSICLVFLLVKLQLLFLVLDKLGKFFR